MIWAASQGNSDVLALLLKNGADINAQDDMGYSALSEAVSVRSPESVKLLLNEGANPELKDKDGNTASSQGKKSRSEAIRSFFVK